MKIQYFRYKIILVILILALISSLLLSFVPLPLICTQLEGCNAVQTSIYAKTFGISNSYYGIVIFILMSLLILLYIRKPNKNTKFLIHMGVFVGTLVSLYFLYLQQFVIHAYCKYCLVIDIGMILALIILNIPKTKKIHKSEEPNIEIKTLEGKEEASIQNG